jgi:hypothetical protein
LLPFLSKKDKSGGIAGTIIKNRQPDETTEESSDKYSAEDCGRDILDAIKSDDAAGLAAAIKELANIADEEPHEEGQHIEPHSYDAQKEE